MSEATPESAAPGSQGHGIWLLCPNMKNSFPFKIAAHHVAFGLAAWSLSLPAAPCFAEARHDGSRVLTNGAMVVEIMDPVHPAR